ncbi:hypothetical protein JQ607_00590 [Bradyrhizobium liaoningense]|uniref:hypothetical protein n=1 Tax=Bradyrhizobium liaoningense TaxID=43992 RepID=UPI001BAC6C55|nr:hypothetical protein [Bradyrhizobium liaoningense]MBR0838687.1 hypothetical protein [Bradyrhizobium liaoningense]
MKFSALFLFGTAALHIGSQLRNFPALFCVIMGLWPAVVGGLGLVSVAGRYIGLATDRLTPAEEHRQIRQYLDELLRSIGGSISEVDPSTLKKLYRQQDFAGMLGFIKVAMRLNLRVGLRLVESASGSRPLSIEVPRPTPAIGSAEFERLRVVVNASKSFLYSSPFDWVVAGFAHELAHVVLFSLAHPLQEEEKAVDLTAMILGFDRYFVRAKVSTSRTTRRKWLSYTETETRWLGYLSIEEREFARQYLKQTMKVRYT